MSVASDIAKREAAAPETTARGRRRRFRLRGLRYLVMLIVPLILLAGAGYAYLASGRYVSTDDSYVKADRVTLSADVPGRVAQILVHDNEPVKAGQVLFRLDDSSYRIALDRAKAQLANSRLQVESLRATYRQRMADLKAAQDTIGYMQREFERQQALLVNHFTPQATFDTARHNLDTAHQQLASMQGQVANIVASLGGDPNIETDKHPMVMQAAAQVAQAELDLAHTVVGAPAQGIVTKVDELQVGNYLNAAVPAFALISSDHVWVEANYKETDLTHMRAGEPATVDVDTYPDKAFSGHVESIGAGTGSEFSVLPAQNATGNWVKVVQRVPVRVAIDNPDPSRPLRPGMSATVEVDTGYEQPLLARIRSVIGR